MKNYLKVSLLCITSVMLYGSENRDKPQKAASFAGTPSPRVVAPNPLAKSAPSEPITIQQKRVVEDRHFSPKSPSKPISVGDFLGLYEEQGSSPSPRDWRSIR